MRSFKWPLWSISSTTGGPEVPPPMFALGISDFSVGEGVYPAKQLLSLARQLGYRDLVCWDRGLAGYPKLRDTLEWIHKSRELEGLPPDPRWTGFRLHLGSRFTWRGHGYGALPFTDAGYAALNRLLSAQAHDAAPGPDIPGLGAPEPPQDCVLLADDLAGLDALLREGLYGALLAHPRRVQEARRAWRWWRPRCCASARPRAWRCTASSGPSTSRRRSSARRPCGIPPGPPSP